jgi:[acyl-carrier-protein] S-malonyltransferase
MLPVSAPFHSSLLRPAADQLAAKLAAVAIASPSIPVIHNVDVAQHRDPAQIREALARQAASPVHWTATVLAMADMGVTHLVECWSRQGAGRPTRRIKEGIPCLCADRQRCDRCDDEGAQ